MNMVLRCDSGAVSLLVDQIGDVIEVEPSAEEPPPSTMDPFHREVVEAVFKLDGKLLLALDTNKLMQRCAQLCKLRVVQCDLNSILPENDQTGMIGATFDTTRK